MAEDLIRIATRRSKLALWQANHVRAALRAAHPDLAVELVEMTTRGDKILDTPLAKVGGKGLFVKELERALLEHGADIAVHSMKDVPVELPAGLHLPVILRREDPVDAFVSNRFAGLAELPPGARVGTSSLRRQCQLRSLRPDLDIRDLRGNVDTRLARLDAGEYAAIILAAAGLMRLGFADRVRARLTPEQCLPAIGQGAIGIECRRNDARVSRLVGQLDDPSTHTCVRAERSMNTRLHGGCQVPIAGHASLRGDSLQLRGLVGRPDGSDLVQGEVQGEAGQADELGVRLAEELLAKGADAILQDLYGKDAGNG